MNTNFLTKENTLVNLLITLIAFFVYVFFLGYTLESALGTCGVLFILLHVFDFLINLFRKKEIDNIE